MLSCRGADYHYIRNFLYVRRHMGQQRADRHMPEFAKRLVAMYDGDGAVSKRCVCSLAVVLGETSAVCFSTPGASVARLQLWRSL